MAVNVIKRTWLQDRMVRPETLNGMAFQAEAGAHRFEITGYDSNGNVMAFSGTVTAIFLRPDNTDVPLTGVISNGVAQVTLSQECYQVPGRFGLAIFVNSGNTKTVVYKCIGPVGMTSSGVEASSVVQSVSTLIDRIEAAVNSIPQDYSALSKSVSATCPEMRDGSTGNPWNTDSITTKYVIKIDKSCDELILEYIGSTQAQYYVFGYSVFNGVADGTESYAARTSAASFLDYPEKYVQTEPYVIIPVSQLGDYTHIAFVLWAKSDETTFIPLRIATEQNNLRVTFRHASYMGHEEINNRSVKVGVQNASKMASPLKLVHFSDLHRDVNALNRIRASAKYVCPNADNIICTGDMVANTYAEITSWWIPEIMTCIGNHDTASYDGTYDWTALTMAQRDEMYISPFKAYWGIVHTAGTSYYYKDYTAAHIRLIVMDAMLYSGTPGAEATAQTQWLANLLASAITGGLHVIIAIHAPHGGSVPVACSFTKLGQETMPVNVDCNTPDVVINTVATAIGNGLHFIGYICGHTHQDAIWDCTGDRSQLMYTVTCAAVDQTAQWIDSDQYRTDEQDAFNVLTIDTASTTIKILRGGGANTDVALRPRVSMVINYSTGKIITDTYASGTQDAVVYGEAQELTDAQKAQARANIGAGSAADVSENTADITANAEEITSLKSAINTIEEVITDNFDETKTVTATYTSGFTIEDYGTAYSGSSNYEGFYISVNEGDIIEWTCNKVSSNPYVKLTFCETIPTANAIATFIEVQKITSGPIVFHYKATNDGYLCITFWKLQVSASTISIKKSTIGYVSETLRDVVGGIVSLAPQKISGLNLVLNATKYNSQSGYETFHIPVKANYDYKWETTPASGSPYIRFGFAESTPANNVGATFLFEISINAKYTFNYHASQDGYLSLTSYVSNVSSSGMAITEDNSNMKRDAEYAENEINVLQKKEYSKYVSYSGQKISLEENPLKISDYISYTDTTTFGTGVWCGGLVVYKNLAFVGIHSGIIAALDLNTLTLAAIGFSSQRSNNHMNNLSFDYDNLVGDYPLLYTSRCHAGNTECYVEKISVNLDCGVIKADLIQTITYSGDYLTETNAVDWALDVKNRKLMMINYDGETQNILFFDVPSTSESTVALTDADITSHYTNTVNPSQGTAIYNDKVYLLSGYANGGALSVLDETTGNVINTIDLNTLMSTQEPEGICIYNNKVYVTTNPGNGLSFHLFALEFM